MKYLFMKCLRSSSIKPSFYWVAYTFIIILLDYLNILGTSLLTNIYIVNVFSQPVAYHLIFLTIFF